MSPSQPPRSAPAARPGADAEPLPGAALEERAARAGLLLRESLADVLARLPGGAGGPQDLARRLALDKVLTSRLLKALRQREPLAVLHAAPGPEPLRRVLRAARRRGVQAEAVQRAEEAVDAFAELIRRDAGDRSALGAILSAWLPEARAEFELRRKQAAFKAMSQLKGAATEVDYSAVFVHPAADPGRLDLVWVICTFGLERLRPGVRVKFFTRRITDAGGRRPRRPQSLGGEDVVGIDRARLDQFCQARPAPLEVSRCGEVVHYVLGDTGFGPGSAVDIVLAEVNRAELPRYVPAGSGRRAFFFMDVTTPAKRLQFDVFVHADVYPGVEPELRVYDTAGAGPADVNDRARDIDLLDVAETVRPLGRGLADLRSPDVPGGSELAAHVHGRLGWRAEDFRGWRVRVDYPIYGSQVCMAFAVPPPPRQRPAGGGETERGPR